MDKDTLSQSQESHSGSLSSPVMSTMLDSSKEKVFEYEGSVPESGKEELSKSDLLTSGANDEAAKIIANYDGPLTWTAEEEKKILRKIDWRLMPILCTTYMLQYWDKAMLGQAAIFGLIQELDLGVGNRYSFAAAIFYLGFLAGAYPSIVLAQRYPIEWVAAGTVSLWGVTLLLTITCFNFQGLYAQRFFLGFLESGVSPMFMMIVGSWYKKNEQAFRMGMWYSLTGWASLFSPLINYGLGHIHGSLEPWKYMYIFAGAITTVWGLSLLVILPGDPTRARGFDERQRYIVAARVRVNNAGVRNTHFKWDQAVELLCDVKFWLMFWIALLSMITNGPISTFAPTIIKGFGYNNLDTLLLFMPAGAYAGIMMLTMSYLAMRFSHRNWRTWIIFGTNCGSILAASLLWKINRTDKAGLFYGIYTLSTFGSGYAVLMGLHVANNSGYTKRSLASSGLYVGYCIGNLIGPLVYFEDEAPIYDTGFTVVVITMSISTALVLVYRYVCIWENRRRDRSGIVESYEHAYDELTDKKNPQFRYIY